MPPFAVRAVDWRTHSDQLQAVRRAVFVEEQGVPEALEWDGADAACRHVIATAPDGSAIGTGRLLPDGRIGRMAVLRAWRGRGVGGAVLAALLTLAREAHCETVRLHAQTHALAFYARFGFVAEGDEFDEAGIPHCAMQLRLGSTPARAT